MTVRELIEALLAMPQEADVVVPDHEWGCYDPVEKVERWQDHEWRDIYAKNEGMHGLVVLNTGE